MSATPLPTAFAPIGSRFFAVTVAVMAVVVVLSNIGASKGVEIGPLVTDGGFFLFPLAYILGDVISEVYGWKASRRAVLATFVMAAFAAGTFWVMIQLPSASFYDGQAALERTLGPVWLVVVASLAGFLVGQLSNSLVMVTLKKRHGEKKLLLRLLGSTGLGEFLDTLIFCSIAASVIGVDSWGAFVNYVVVGFVWKTLVEVVLSPLTVLVIGWVKRREPGYVKAVAAERG
ncbi:queuosine precursor transporter [Galactobacter caseinivorans]|uniref:Probable queuosine precursor transporter n=1 Tax=Galactobacter caseinivorans TaxID=2676123 RepID=A0A496PHF5_9MICC|nr:queuosine precursor transporter [Galactobacter caseinivorans]RKW69899.1 VUT family protein [Galactobacter caseinivorans]